MSGKLPMAVIGTGHFGKFHAQKIVASQRAELCAVADIDAARAKEVGDSLGVRSVSDYRELFGEVEAVCIAVPTHAHHAVASDCLSQGLHVLIEKPIADSLEAADSLIALAKEHDRILQVGHLVRFSGVAAALRNHATRPLYIDSLRITPFRGRGTDVNVILDLMIHDIDLVLSLIDAPIIEIDAAGAPVFSENEDICNARIKFANGCIATITASRISFKTERRMRIFQPSNYLSVNFDEQSLNVVRRAKEGNVLPGVDIAEHRYEEVDALEQEIESFITCILENKAPLVGGEEGRQALEAALTVTRKLQEHARFVMSANSDDDFERLAKG